MRLQTHDAGNVVALAKVPGADGLSWGQAVASITSTPAEIMGLGAELGSLKPGRRADVVVWDGDPLELSSAPEKVFIDGVEQPLVTRQSRLDRKSTRLNSSHSCASRMPASACKTKSIEPEREHV